MKLDFAHAAGEEEVQVEVVGESYEEFGHLPVHEQIFGAKAYVFLPATLEQGNVPATEDYPPHGDVLAQNEYHDEEEKGEPQADVHVHVCDEDQVEERDVSESSA